MSATVSDAQMAEKAAIDIQIANQNISIDTVIETGMIELETAVPTTIDDMENNMIVREDELSDVIDRYVQFENTNNTNITLFQICKAGFNKDYLEAVMYKHTFNMYGDVNTFYPLPFKFNVTNIKKLLLYRGMVDDVAILSTGGVEPCAIRLELSGKGGGKLDDTDRLLHIKNDSRLGAKCVGAIGIDLYCSDNGAPDDYCNDFVGGMYIRGGITYTIETDDSVMLDYIKTILNTASPSLVWGVQVADPISDIDMESLQNDPRISISNKIEGL